MSLSIALMVAGISGVVFFLGYLVLLGFGRYQAALEIRLQDLPKGTSRTPGNSARRLPTSGWWSAAKRLVPHRENDLRPFRLRLARAGLFSPKALPLFFVVRLIAMALPIAAGLVAYYFGLIGQFTELVLCGSLSAFGFIAPSLWIERRINHRQRALRRALPDFLDLMIVCLESGLSMQGAVKRVSDEINTAHPMLGAELGIVQRDMTLGSAVDLSFRNFADRTGLDVVRTLSTFINHSRRFGSELVDAFRSYADMLRYEREQRAEEQAQKASVKILIPMLLLILPAVFVVLAGPAAIQIQQAFSK